MPDFKKEGNHTSRAQWSSGSNYIGRGVPFPHFGHDLVLLGQKSDCCDLFRVHLLVYLTLLSSDEFRFEFVDVWLAVVVTSRGAVGVGVATSTTFSSLASTVVSTKIARSFVR